MKHILLLLYLFLFTACDVTQDVRTHVSDTNIACDDLDNINWSNKVSTIATLESCYASHNPALPVSIESRIHVDAMLYLSYIYLSDGQHQDIDRANIILQHAITEMSKDCEKSHGTYDNFCYMVHFKNEEHIPAQFNALKDAMHIYHMSMPCVYPEMLIENPDAIELIGPYFGSSRDTSIPNVCNYFPYHIIDLRAFMELENYSNLENKYSDGPIEGTMRFGTHQGQYQNMIEMLFFPDKKLADNNPDDPYIMVYSIGEEPEPIKTRLKPFESDIRQYPDLNEAYDKMIENTTRHYVDFLHLSPDVAAQYAPITVLSTLYNFVLY
ncbi:hypothetical protein HDR61_03870 [bacterium]|nr:hypothetical protein [bacterium]